MDFTSTLCCLPVAQDAKRSMWTAVTWQTETNSVIEVKALFAGFTMKSLITWMTLTLPWCLVAALHIQASNLRTVTQILWKEKEAIIKPSFLLINNCDKFVRPNKIESSFDFLYYSVYLNWAMYTADYKTCV